MIAILVLGVTSSEQATSFSRCPFSAELNNYVNSGHSRQQTHSIAAGCKKGRLMQPPFFSSSALFLDELAKRCTLVGKLSAVAMHRSPACGCNHAAIFNVFADVGQCPLCDMARAIDV